MTRPEFSLNSVPKFFIQKAFIAYIANIAIFGIISVHWHQNHKKIPILTIQNLGFISALFCGEGLR